MHDFAVVALLGLVVLKVGDLLDELVPGLSRFRHLLTYALAVAVAVAIDFSVFAGWGIDVRETWMGTWATGLIIGSLATVWRALLGWFGAQEGEVPGEERGRPRMAA